MVHDISRRQFLSSSALALNTAYIAQRARAGNSGQGSPAAGNWNAGVARAISLPDTSVWLAGYGTKRAPDGKLHDLWMKALALEDHRGMRAVFITSDFQGVPKMMSDRVFSQLSEKYDLPRSQVMFTISHNHCGPRLGDDLIDYYPVDAEQEQLVTEYTDLMVERSVHLWVTPLPRWPPQVLKLATGKQHLPLTVATTEKPMFPI
jgi:neutral ceramidase